MSKEIWKKIIINGLLTPYEASTFGNIRRNGKILIPCKVHNGYMKITMCYSGIQITPRVHRIIAQIFIPNPDSKNVVNHKNFIRDDNRVENLEWVTTKENGQWGAACGRYPRGKDNPNAKINPQEAIQMYKGGVKVTDIAKHFGCSWPTVYQSFKRYGFDVHTMDPRS